MSHSFSEIQIQELPAVRVVCTRVISANPEDEVLSLLQNWLKKHGLTVEGRRSFGFDTTVSQAETDLGLRGYECGVEIPETVAADGGMQIRLYSGGTYAVMRVINAFEEPFTSIPAGWHKLQEWATQNTEFRPTWNLCYEEVVSGETGMDLILYLNMKK